MMAEETSSIFNAKAAAKLRSPDDLDKYVRVTNPGVWVVIVACIALLAGLLAWGVFGTVATNVAATGANVDGQVVCFLNSDDVAKVSIGDSANVEGHPMEVTDVSATPLSAMEAWDMLQSDYLSATIFDGEWNYAVTLSDVSGEGADLELDVPLRVTITVERTMPLSLVFGGRS